MLPFPPEIQTAWPELGARSLTTHTTSCRRCPASTMLNGWVSVGSGTAALPTEGDEVRGTASLAHSHPVRLPARQSSAFAPGLSASWVCPGGTHGAAAGAERQPAAAGAAPWQLQRTGCRGLSPHRSCAAHRRGCGAEAPPPLARPRSAPPGPRGCCGNRPPRPGTSPPPAPRPSAALPAGGKDTTPQLCAQRDTGAGRGER